MKKIIVGVVLLLVVAGVCVPIVNGFIMEKVVREFQNDLNEMYVETGSGVTIEIIKYDRNFFSSEIEWSIKLGSLQSMYGVDEIILVDQVDHGFTGVLTKTSLEKNQWFVDLLNDKLGGKNPLNITTAYKLSGEIESIIDIDAFSFQVKEETVNFRPGRVVTECGKGLTHLLSEATWEGLAVPDKAGMEGVSLIYDLDKISTYIWDGKISYTIDTIKIDDQGENFELVDFKGEYTLDFDRGKIFYPQVEKLRLTTLLPGTRLSKILFSGLMQII